MIRLILSLILSVALNSVFSQNIILLNKLDSVPITNVDVIINGFSTGIQTDTAGKMTIPDNLKIKTFCFFSPGYNYSKVFYKNALDTIDIVFLEPLFKSLEEQIIVFYKPKSIDVSLNHISINPNEVMNLPSVFGEGDIMKIAQLLPGVSSVFENNVGLVIRCGSAEQSLTSLDGATLFNPSHSVGFFSAVHPETVESAALYKDGFMGTLGGRASAFYNITMKEGNYANYRSSINLGAISTSITLEGPMSIGHKPTSFIINGRTTYIDKILDMLNPDLNNRMGFNDLSLKLSRKISSAKKLTLSFYSSNDFYDANIISLLNNSDTVRWKNNLIALNYFSENKNSEKHFHLSYSSYSSTMSGSVQNTKSSINEIQIMYLTNQKKTTSIFDEKGVQGKFNIIAPSRISNANSTLQNLGLLELTPFISSTQTVLSSWKLKGVLRLPFYISSSFSTFIPEPRLVLSKELKNTTLSFSYDRLSQFLQLYNPYSTFLPTSTWVMSTKDLSPIVSGSFTATLLHNFNNRYTFTTSIFHRNFNNISDVKAGIPLSAPKNYEKWLAIGKRDAMGIEFLFKKNFGTLSGWISYTYSRSFNYIDGLLENGSKYPSNFDKPSIFNLILVKKIKNWSFSSVFIFQTGRPISLPIYGNSLISIYSERNEFRLPNYHRLDLSLNYQWNRKRHHQSKLCLNIYNVYNHKNVYDIQLNLLTRKVDYFTLFPILPFVSYKVEIF